MLSMIAFSAFAAPLVPGSLPRNGNCPANYQAKGNECEPLKDARYAVGKSGACPANYEADGNYCLASPDARLAMRRAAMTCPKGYTPAEDYCISDK